jgi:transposase
MGYVQGEGRTQATLFPVTLEELIPDDHVCRVIDAFVDRLDMAGLGFERAEAAETGRPGYDPRDLLKLYLYGYFQQIRSSRRLESECRRNIVGRNEAVSGTHEGSFRLRVPVQFF